MIEGANGWTPWITPRTTNYRLSCCDCGLAHDVQFRILARGGKWVDLRTVQIKIRFHRNVRATAALRRGTPSAAGASSRNTGDQPPAGD